MKENLENFKKEDLLLLINEFKKTESKNFVASIFDEGVYKFVDSKILGVFKNIHTVKMEATLFLTNTLRTLDRNGFLTEKIEGDIESEGYVVKSGAEELVKGILPRCFFFEVVGND